MRTFFAFDIPPAVKLDIDQWRSKVYANAGLSTPAPRAVPAANFHITLQFNGATNERQLAHFLNADISVSAFKLCCKEVGYFSKPKVGFLLVDDHPKLTAAEEQCRILANQQGIASQHARFTPHITLYRKLPQPLLVPLIPPRFDFMVDTLALFESRSTEKGVAYIPIRKWCAKPNT